MSPKTPISIRIDAEILEQLRAEAGSRPYQALIQQVLAEHVRARHLKQQRVAGRAQEIFKRYYAQCFWHYSPELKIDTSNISLVIDGLKKYGGREGLKLAEELCQ